MGWITRTCRPNHTARKAEAAAANQVSSVNQQSNEQQNAAAERKRQALESLITAYSEAKKEVEAWYEAEVLKAQEAHQQKQSELAQVLGELSQVFIQAKAEIDAGYNAQKAEFVKNQQQDEQKLEVCRLEVIKQARRTSDYYGQYKHVLDSLWQEVESSMLHKQCQDAYVYLKQPLPRIAKAKHLSLLIAYLRHLSKQNYVTNADFERYKKFLSALYASDKVLKANLSFVEIDTEIKALFAKANAADSNSAGNAYKADSGIFNKSYAAAKEFKGRIRKETRFSAATNSKQIFGRDG